MTKRHSVLSAKSASTVCEPTRIEHTIADERCFARMKAIDIPKEADLQYTRTPHWSPNYRQQIYIYIFFFTYERLYFLLSRSFQNLSLIRCGALPIQGGVWEVQGVGKHSSATNTNDSFIAL
jgi:hypothetical protein